MYKKLYLWGLSLTLVMMIIRFVFLFKLLTVELVINEIIITLFMSHFFLATFFFVSRIQRSVYSENFINLAITGIWFTGIFITFGGLAVYVASIVMREVEMSLFNGVFMAIIGLWMENHLGRMEELEQEAKAYRKKKNTENNEEISVD